MTPFGLRLQHRLENETLRMQNEWFFKWHFIGKDGPVEIDSFDGRMLKYGGIGFFGTAREVYWNTLRRYISGKIDEIFAELELTLSNYPIEMSKNIIKDVVDLLLAFNRKIADIAVEKDKILRGNGFDFPPPDKSRAAHILQAQNISQRASALISLVDTKLEALRVQLKKPETQRSVERRNMSFRDFKEELLVAIAIQVKGIPSENIAPINAAKTANLIYRSGWIDQAVRALKEDGFLNANFFMGPDLDANISASITGRGLEKVEEYCNARGSDLWEEIDEKSEQTEKVVQSATPSAPASDRIVDIDHNSAAYKEIIEKIDEVSNSATKSNSLSSEYSLERDQRLAEIKAGKILLQAPQANAEKVKLLLVGALKWIGERIADNVVAFVITGLITLILGFLGFV